MLNVGKIEEGFVLDHIKAGKSLAIYHHLQLDKLDCTVAIIKNAKSNKMGKKDILKVECDINMLDLDVLAFIDHNITVNVIKDSPTSLSSQMKNGRFTAVNTVKKNIVESCKNEGRRSTSTYSCGGFFMRWQLQMSSVVTLCPHGTEYQRRQCNSCRHGCCK